MNKILLFLAFAFFSACVFGQVDLRTNNLSVNLDNTGNASITVQDIDDGSITDSCLTGMDYSVPTFKIKSASNREMGFSSGFVSTVTNGVPFRFAPVTASSQVSSSFDGIKVRSGDLVFVRSALNNGSRPSGENIARRNTDGRLVWGGIGTTIQFFIEQFGVLEGEIIDFSQPFYLKVRSANLYLGGSGSIGFNTAPQDLRIEILTGDPGFQNPCPDLTLSLDKTTFDCSDVNASKSQRALSFQSGAQGVSLGNVSDFQGAFTMEMWIKTITPNQMILSQWESGVAGRFAWFFQGNGTVSLITNVAPFDATVIPSSTSVVADGRWHHIACTYDYNAGAGTGVLRMYVDGELEDTTSPLGFSTSAIGRIVQIGAEESSSGFLPFTQGQMDNVRIWDTARTGAQIKSSMTVGNLSSPNLLRQYTFDSLGNQVIDATGAGSPITLNNSNISKESLGVRVVVSGTDGVGNTASTIAHVEVIDNTAPQFNTLSNIDAEATSTGNAMVTYPSPIVTDNCVAGAPDAGALAAPVGTSYIGFFNGNYYFLSDTADTVVNNYVNAALSGHYLVKIESDEENNFINTALINAGEASVQIGLDDTVTEGTFTWQDGTALTYADWNSGEPNNSGSGEDYTAFYTNATNPFWNDVGDGFTSKYLIEIPIAGPEDTTYLGSFNGHTYFVSNTAVAASDAFAKAVNGNSLLKINSQAENDFIQSVTGSLGFEVLFGLNDLATEGTFVYNDGTPVTYTNWNTGEPNNSGGNEDYAAFRPGTGVWNDSNNPTLRYIIESESPIVQTAGLVSGANFPVGTTTNTFLYTDRGGNTATASFDVNVTAATPPTLTAVSILSNNSNTSIAKAGNAVTLSFTASEDITGIAINIAGQSLTPQRQGNNQNWQAVFNVPRTQQVSLLELANGVLPFTIDFEDLAGNIGTQVSTTTDGSQVTLNRIPPTAIAQDLELCPDGSNNYTLTTAALDNGSSDPDGAVTTTVGTALTTNRPSITFNATHINQGSVFFDGNDKRIATTINELPTSNAARTLEFWMKPINTGRFQTVLDYGGNGAQGRITVFIEGNELRVRYGNTSSADLVIQTNINTFDQWAHYSITYENRVFKFYKNGVLVGQHSISIDLRTENSQLFLGNRSGDFNLDFRGNLSELRIYNRSKTATEINNEYDKYLNGLEEGLVYYNKLNEGSGSAMDDGRFGTAGNLLVGGGGSQPVWSNDYPAVPFQNEIGTYHAILSVRDTNGNIDTANAVITLKDDAPVIITQSPTAVIDANGVASITAQQVDNGTTSCSSTTVSITKNTFTCED